MTDKTQIVHLEGITRRIDDILFGRLCFLEVNPYINDKQAPQITSD